LHEYEVESSILHEIKNRGLRGFPLIISNARDDHQGEVIIEELGQSL
jgi:hypothetical protein